MSPFTLTRLPGLPLFALLTALPALARQITVKNSCTSTIWPGMHTGTGTVPSQATGWEMAAGETTTFEVADDWTAGRIWARTGCVVQDGAFQCLTGQCGAGAYGSVLCENSDQPPATLAEFMTAEFTLIPGGEDNFDISLVDGFNIPLNIIPSISSCPEPQCQVNINALCPAVLRTALDQNGVNLACMAPCNAGFGEELYGNRACCTGAYTDSTLCVACGIDYYSLFKDNCNTSYAYAYDEKSKTALWTCTGGADYTIEFCPAGSDYVGTEEPSDAYVSATATCSSLATAFDQTFSVGPSPTGTASIGTLTVVAGAAAAQPTASGSGGGTGSPAAVTAVAATAKDSEGAAATTTPPAVTPTTTTPAATPTTTPAAAGNWASAAASAARAGNPHANVFIVVGSDTVAEVDADQTGVTAGDATPSGNGADLGDGDWLTAVRPGGHSRSRGVGSLISHQAG